MITNFKLIGESGSMDAEQVRTYTKVFQVTCDSIYDKVPEILSHPLCPVANETRLEEDNLATCTKVSPVYRKNTRYIWDTTAEFSTYRPNRTPPGKNPLQDPAIIIAESELSMEEQYTDLDNLPNLNAAGDLVLIKIPVCRMTFKVRKNVSVVNGWLNQVSGLVNSAPVRLKGVLYPRGTLQVWGVQLGDVETKSDIDFFVCDLVIKHKQEGWLTSYPNTGFNEMVLHPDNRGPEKKLLDPRTGKPIMVKQRCLDGPDGWTGDPVSSPVFLDENGQRPRVQTIFQGKQMALLKDPLELSDILFLKRRYVSFVDFNTVLPIR